jgi:histidinol-phosphate aminotransferase
MTTGPKPPEGASLPINLGLNDGTYCPQSVADTMVRLASRTGLRNYSEGSNLRLRQAIAEKDGVHPDNVFLHNGSGPILKMVVPFLVRREIKRSPVRIIKHLTVRKGYPLVTPRLTYSKVPKKGLNAGLTIEMVPLEPETGFTLDPAKVEAAVRARDSFVYICSPNNPTGNVLISRTEVERLARAYPQSIFWIDEAYVQYVDPSTHEYVSPLAGVLPNVMVGRTFSFAYGMAGLRLGYLLADKELVSALNAKLTDYRVGTLHEELGMAALSDPDHLPDLWKRCAQARSVLTQGFSRFEGVEMFPSQTNFVLGRFTDGRTGAWLRAELEKRGVLIKKFDSFGDVTYDEYFRLTIGTPEENAFLVASAADVLD